MPLSRLINLRYAQQMIYWSKVRHLKQFFFAGRFIEASAEEIPCQIWNTIWRGDHFSQLKFNFHPRMSNSTNYWITFTFFIFFLRLQSQHTSVLINMLEESHQTTSIDWRMCLRKCRSEKKSFFWRK